jgi:transcriptional regulator with XRE-family HTH domain
VPELPVVPSCSATTAPMASCLHAVQAPWWLLCSHKSGFSTTGSEPTELQMIGGCEHVTVPRLAMGHRPRWGFVTMATAPPAELRALEVGLGGTWLSRGYSLPIFRLAATAHVAAIERADLSPMASLRELLRWTGGSAEDLAELLGASRRSIYNWLNGRPLRGEFAARATRLRTVLAPLGTDWHPQALANWLKQGRPLRARLAREERWAELEEQVRAAVKPLRPDAAPQLADRVEDTPPAPLLADAVITALQEFSSPPPVTSSARRSWTPHELTGATPRPEEG